jgi:hypothetical protein
MPPRLAKGICDDGGRANDLRQEKIFRTFSEITDQDLAQVIELWERMAMNLVRNPKDKHSLKVRPKTR